MAIPLDIDVSVSSNDRFSPYFESLWYELSLLTTVTLPQADLNLPIFSGGIATSYFESIWNIAADDLGKDNIDTSVILIDDEGRATPELEAYWEDLTT